jgi:hypothetical protein
VLDSFVGGDAIPLEAMRLVCDVMAIDINPVAWFIEVHSGVSSSLRRTKTVERILVKTVRY